MFTSYGVVKAIVDPPKKVNVRRVLKVDTFDPGGAGVRALVNALAGAACRLEEEMCSGEEAFDSADQRRSAHRLIGQASRLIELSKNHPPPPDPNIRFIPPCPKCNAKAGEHWAHECPKLDRFGRECTWDYRKNQVLFYEQIRPLVEPLKPHPRDVFMCVVCKSRWQGMTAEKLLEEGHTFGEADREEIFKFFKERGL